MADPCCDVFVGGIIFVSVGDQRFEGMGEAKIRPRTVERTAGATEGGRLWVTEKAVPAQAELNFVNLCDADPLDLFDARCGIDVTIVDQTRGFRHLFSQSVVVGTPEINVTTGEVSGLKIASVHYTVHEG